MVLLFCFVASGTVTNLFPTVVKTLGYSNIVSLLLTVPPYVLAVITTFLNAWHADRTGERYFHITLPLYFAVFAFILAAATTATAPRYVAMMFMVPGVYTGYVVALAWISNTLPRPPAKVCVILFPVPGALHGILNLTTRCSAPQLWQPSTPSLTALPSTRRTCILSLRAPDSVSCRSHSVFPYFPGSQSSLVLPGTAKSTNK